LGRLTTYNAELAELADPKKLRDRKISETMSRAERRHDR
jgi:hypothetical protein